jgi:hypothetical protein
MHLEPELPELFGAAGLLNFYHSMTRWTITTFIVLGLEFYRH